MKKTIIFIFFFYSLLSYSQNYTALDTTDYKIRKKLIEDIESELEIFNKELKKSYKGKKRKKIIQSYTELYNTFLKDIKKKKLVFNTHFTSYIDSITQSLIDNNDTLLKNRKLRVYVTKNNSPNALSMGRGFVLLNMGLFKYLKNEDQLAAVLSHEIAHQILNHTKKNILHTVNLETSKEKREQSKKIKKKKYNKQSEAFSALKDILYSNKKKHRIEEIEADSIGFILYKNTNYQPKEFVNALSLLAKFDSLPNISLKKETYKKYFDLKEQPFKEEWMKIEDFNSYNYNNFKEKINQDSIKSHPEIYERITKIKSTFAKELLEEKPFINNSKYKELQGIARNEDIPNLSYSEDYGISIYLTLFKLEKNPTNLFLKEWLGINFQKLYEAKKKYQFNRHVHRLVPNEQSESYQQFISFLWNLRLNEIKNIANYYSKTKKAED